jgi:Basic region leucine zipper
LARVINITIPYRIKPALLNRFIKKQVHTNNVVVGIGDFTFPDYPPFPQVDGFTRDSLPAMPLQIHTTQQTAYATSNIGSPQSGLVSPQNSEKRNAHDPPYASTFEDASRIAAEEDKRRRNTAASARFRVKKKQREQALEKSAKEMSDKVAALEGRINQLETENKWLKNLIMEKNDNKDDIAALWNKYSQGASDTEPSSRKDGVGTGKD